MHIQRSKGLVIDSEGGVVFDSEGNKVMEFVWGLGKTTNNHAKVLAVFMGLHLI
jgi:hypothetical protein